MKKSLKRFSLILLCLIMLLSIFYKKVEAKSGVTLTGIAEGASYFKNNSNGQEIFDEQAQKEGVASLYFICLGIGIFVAVVGGIYIGIKFVTSGVEGQAKVKEKLIPYVVGCIVVFGAFGIWGATIKITQRVIPQDTTFLNENDTTQNNNLPSNYQVYDDSKKYMDNLISTYNKDNNNSNVTLGSD